MSKIQGISVYSGHWGHLIRLKNGHLSGPYVTRCAACERLLDTKMDRSDAHRWLWQHVRAWYAEHQTCLDKADQWAKQVEEEESTSPRPVLESSDIITADGQ